MALGKWEKVSIVRDNGEIAEAQAPVIVSASRSTDIPTYYPDWFFHRLKVGYSAWTNPFNGQRLFVDYRNTRFIVFWSKQPLPMLPYLDQLKERENPIDCYLQYSLNDYETVKTGEEDLGIELRLASLQSRIDTFRQYSEKLGKERVIWRFDPLLLTNRIDIDSLLERIERVGNQLYQYTNRLVFSFADIACYRNVQNNLRKYGIQYEEWTNEKMEIFTSGLVRLNQKWKLELATCGEKIDLDRFGVTHSHCIDEDLIIKLAWKDRSLMNYLKVQIQDAPYSLNDMLTTIPEVVDRNLIKLSEGKVAIKYRPKHGNVISFYKDKGQREACGCTAAKDIGEYKTCLHRCQYCYANGDKSWNVLLANWKKHCANRFGETITGD